MKDKMRVKIFSAVSDYRLTTEINDWLKENETSISVLNMEMKCSADRIVVMALYVGNG